MTAPKTTADATAKALYASLVSPNEADSNGEPANVVDGLFAIARAIDTLAMAITGPGHRGNNPLSDAIRSASGEIVEAFRDSQS